ncbi:hypothetical protein Ccrd_020268 [Cynara cardunculus var. scolymus]|uniref:S-adenosyl-L-methionine-dependent methyltransferase n=1 Tax=Cynara cardunculus var. scolymus TaxID=59895 RepID=A0A124SEX2_CYNCS|nr:hypothetical protein Ccrd_020268 [Cynara cardunculus var. scolymus]
MFRDESACNTYNYGDSVYWDARYVHEASAGSFDWYQRYHALRPFVRKYIPISSRVLMVGCGNAGLVNINLVDCYIGMLLGYYCYSGHISDSELKLSFPIAPSLTELILFPSKSQFEEGLYPFEWLPFMSEDMVKDGYESIMNVDISCVAIEMMRRKYEHVPQLK